MASPAGSKRKLKLTEDPSLNFQSGSSQKPINSGKKPLPEPTGLKQVAVMLLMHICRRIVLIGPRTKVGFYLAALVFGSLVSDFIPFPHTYLSSKDNIFNQYFVKLAWGWTLIFLGSFMYLTSFTYCCGNHRHVKIHLSRLVVSTAMWYFWTNLFVYIESKTGICQTSLDKFPTRSLCIKGGFRWHGFDISGHSFLLIYCNLLIMEETKCFRGWERIGELIRWQNFEEESPLKPLKEEEVSQLRIAYPQLTPYIKCLFGALTMLLILWDVMLVVTILYYHSMAQKVAGGLIAVVIWYLTYRVWYTMSLSPGLPGEGPFKYAHVPPKGSTRKNSIRRSVVRN